MSGAESQAGAADPDPRRDAALHVRLDGAGMKRRTVSGAGITALAQAVKFVLQMGTQVVLARMLDPAQFGLVAMVAPVLGLALAIADSGLGQAIVQRPDLTHRQVTAMFWINLAVGSALMLLAMAAAPLVSLLYGEPRTAWVTLASAGLILLSSLSLLPQALLNRQMRFGALAGIEVACMVAGLASGITAAWLGAGFWALVVMQAVNATLTAALAWAACGWLPGPPRREPGAGALLRFGANIMGANLASYLNMSAAQVIIGVANGKVALGLYDRSYNLVVRPLFQLMMPFSRVTVPLLARLQDTPERYRRAYLLMLQVTHVACVPGLIAVVVAAGPLIALLLGPKWAAMVPVFAWIGFGGTAAALSGSTYWLFTSQARAQEQMRFGVATALLNVASIAIGAPWGAVGVACATALSFVFVQTPMVVWAATRRGPVGLAMLWRGLAPLLGAALVAAAATMAALHWAGPRPLLQVVAAFVVAYGSFLLSLVAQPAGRRLLADARASLPGRPAAA